MKTQYNKLILAFSPASDGGLSERGSEVAMYDYAHFCEKLLGHKSIICLKTGAYNVPCVLDKFKKRFNSFVYYRDFDDLENKLIEMKVDGMYSIRSNPKNGALFTKIPMFIHCVYDMELSPSYICAGVSKSVADKIGSNSYVPHMIHLEETPDNYRKILNIPEDAVVFGRHGGYDTWDLQIAKDAIIDILRNRDDVYFIFAVRPHILGDIIHPRLIFMDSFADLTIKRKFINTCDAYLHAQSLGESFGISCGEMSMANKPIITWNGGVMQEHLRILGDKCVKYNNKDELYDILNTFDPNTYKNNDWRSYSDYTPEKIMNKFKEVFLYQLPLLKLCNEQDSSR